MSAAPLSDRPRVLQQKVSHGGQYHHDGVRLGLVRQRAGWTFQRVTGGLEPSEHGVRLTFARSGQRDDGAVC